MYTTMATMSVAPETFVKATTLFSTFVRKFQMVNFRDTTSAPRGTNLLRCFAFNQRSRGAHSPLHQFSYGRQCHLHCSPKREGAMVPNGSTHLILHMFNERLQTIADDRAGQRTDEGMVLLTEIKKAGLAPNVTTYTNLIKACAHAQPVARAKDAFELYNEMLECGVKPNVLTYTVLIDVCANTKPTAAVDDALTLLEVMQDSGVTPTVVTYNSVLKACSNAGGTRVDTAIELFSNIRKHSDVTPNLITFNTMIKVYAYAKPHPRVEDALNLFDEMKTLGLEPSTVTYVALINTCSSVKAATHTDKALDLYDEMCTRGPNRNTIMYNCLIKVYANAKPQRLHDAVGVLDEMERTGVARDEYTLAWLLKCCRKFGKAPTKHEESPITGTAVQLFKRVIGPVSLTPRVWNALVGAVGSVRAKELRAWVRRTRKRD